MAMLVVGAMSPCSSSFSRSASLLSPLPTAHSSGMCQPCPVAPGQVTLHLRAPCPGHPPSACTGGELWGCWGAGRGSGICPALPKPRLRGCAWAGFQPFHPNPEFSPSGDPELAEGMAERCLE